MKEALKRIVDAFHKYNSEHMAAQAFGLSEDIVYDALVIAPPVFHRINCIWKRTARLRRYTKYDKIEFETISEIG